MWLIWLLLQYMYSLLNLVPRLHPWKAERGSGILNDFLVTWDGFERCKKCNYIPRALYASLVPRPRGPGYEANCMHTRSHARLPTHHHIYYAFCNLIRALRSESCDKKSRSGHQTLSLVRVGHKPTHYSQFTNDSQDFSTSSTTSRCNSKVGSKCHGTCADRRQSTR